MIGKRKIIFNKKINTTTTTFNFIFDLLCKKSRIEKGREKKINEIRKSAKTIGKRKLFSAEIDNFAAAAYCA